MTVTHSTLISNTAQSGGAIANWSGVTTLEDSIVMSNTATSPCCAGDGGGGIWNRSGAAMTVRRSTISANSTTQDDGGAIANQGSLELLNSTLSDNSAAISGGALFAIAGAISLDGVALYDNRAQQWDGGAIDNNGAVLTITNSTFSGNTAIRNGGAIATDGHSNPNRLTNVTVVSNTTAGNGGGIYAVSGQLTMQGSILAHNTASGGIGADCVGPLGSLDYNLIEDTGDCALVGPVDHTITGQDPGLGPLQDNGGSTLTHALLEGSPAIDSGGESCPDTDQRGVFRPWDGDGDSIARCDMGAFEWRDEFSVFLPLIQR
jgi:predicted outer membrane repeat protein